MGSASYRAACLFFVVWGTLACAETGMCLVVCRTDAASGPGEIRRIDFRDNAVIRTSGVLGTGNHARFSPDGTRFVYISGTTVNICNLDGSVQKSFTVPVAGKVSFTNNGIYLGGPSASTAPSRGRIYLYDLNGVKTWEKEFDYCGEPFVSQNGKTAAGVVRAAGTDGQTNWRVTIHDLASGRSVVCGDEQGCSACPSPDGTMVTQNRGGPFSQCHLEMRIRRADGSHLYRYYIEAVTGLKIADKWSWNTQKWSGNSNDWIILPIGQTNRTSGCSQLDLNCSPWIHNIRTKESYRLANRTSDFWMPTDYYSGTVYEPVTAALSLAPVSLSFSADSGAAAIPAKTVTASTASGTLSGLTLSGAPSWLTARAAATSGASIAITNSVSAAGLRPGTYNATVTVTTSNAGSRSYAVAFTVNSVRPALRVLYPNGGERLRVGQTVSIRWEADTAKVTSCIVDISLDEGLSWHTITGVSGIGFRDQGWGNYPWTIPATLTTSTGEMVSTVSSKCLVMVYKYGEPNTADESDGLFSIQAASTVLIPPLSRTGRRGDRVTLFYDIRGARSPDAPRSAGIRIIRYSEGETVRILPPLRSGR